MARRPAPERDEWRFTPTPREWRAKVRVSMLAERQFGRVRWDQMLAAEVGRSTISRWVTDGYLQPKLPRVYAVGHAAPSREGDLAAALLYAGPGAALSHATGLWWWGLLDHPPDPIQVSTPRRVASRPGLEIYGRREVERLALRGLEVCTVERAVLDFAATAARDRLRFVLANADYRRQLRIGALEALTGRGVAGSAALRAALAEHRPQLAHTRSEFERRLIGLAERHGLPLPRFNVRVGGHLVDAVWTQARVIVELDGYAAHRSPAQLRRDHRRDLALRALGYLVLRYAWDQLASQPEAVAADIARALEAGAA